MNNTNIILGLLNTPLMALKMSAVERGGIEIGAQNGGVRSLMASEPSL